MNAMPYSPPPANATYPPNAATSPHTEINREIYEHLCRIEKYLRMLCILCADAQHLRQLQARYGTLLVLDALVEQCMSRSRRSPSALKLIEQMLGMEGWM